MSTAIELLKGSVTRVSQTFVSIVVAFFMMPFLIHELGDHWYGIWTVVGSLAAAYHLFDMGMASAVTRYVSRAFGLNDDQQANVTINTALAIYIAIAVVIILVSIVASAISRGFIDNEADKDTIQWLVLIIGVSVALEFPFNALAGVANAKLKFHQVALVRIIMTLLGAVLTWWFISIGYGVVALAVITFCTARVSNILYYLVCKSAFPALRISLSLAARDNSKELFKYSIWSFVIAIAYQMRNNVDNFVIAGFLSAASVTPYAIGLRLVDYVAQFLSQATNMFVPIFTAYHAKEDNRELHSKLLFITRLNLVLALIAGGGLVIFGEAFINRWMGPSYSEAYWVMVILLVGRMIGFANHPLNSAMYAANKHSIVAKIDVVEVSFNLVLSLILVQYYDLIGVALGTMIPLLTLRAFVLPFFACRSIDMPAYHYYACLIRPFLATTLPLVSIYLWVHATVKPEDYFQLAGLSALMIIIAAGIGVKFGFSDSEKTELRKLLPIKQLKILI
ncbi:lipopolysaccharide biosynthesis protein [Marinobacter litoralis]|uniref:lipopolysaccharide biosynthesis protein n=1 Tax=Marinobacter litoralis TaxID=187981 RepID=UPI0018EAD808|nr:oligosaccharide flippase family protein [Marinobacter litoralis]MBJ6137698.1 oligosaccharide flippase family protein [Marinobacter litoralis]